MDSPIADLSELLCSLQPVLNAGVFVFASVPARRDLQGIAVLSTFHEAEGVSVIAEEREAARANLPVLFRAGWITLNVRSDLQAVGLTAAVADALGAANISCNIVAAAHHDHIFVPIEAADAALHVLQALQRNAETQTIPARSPRETQCPPSPPCWVPNGR